MRHLRRRAAVRGAGSEDARNGRLRRRHVPGAGQASRRLRRHHAALGRGARAGGADGPRRRDHRQPGLYDQPRRSRSSSAIPTTSPRRCWRSAPTTRRRTPADLKGKRISAAKGSTSELSITLNGSEPVTFQDTGSAYMALQQNKSVGMVANTMTITKLVNQSQTAGAPLKMIQRAHAARAGRHRHEEGRAGAAATRSTRRSTPWTRRARSTRMWNKWLGPEHGIQADPRRARAADHRDPLHAHSVMDRV